MGSVGNSTSTTNMLRVLRIENNQIQQDLDNERDEFGYTLREQLRGTIEWFAYTGTMRKVGITKDGTEYGIVGYNRRTNSRYNYNAGYVGYKIKDGVMSLARFSPASIANATKYVREKIKDPNAQWRQLGRIQ